MADTETTDLSPTAIGIRAVQDEAVAKAMDNLYVALELEMDRNGGSASSYDIGIVKGLKTSLAILRSKDWLRDVEGG